MGKGANFLKLGYKYTGAMRVLETMLRYDYFWTKIRVQGGAYGCSSIFKRAGDAYFASYRDPHLGRTLDVYAGIPEYLKNFTADEKEMTRFIIGTISGLDTSM